VDVVNMNEIARLQQLAGIVSEGDGEPGVDYKSDTGEGETKKVAVDLHKMLKDLPDSDFPHWWQAKVVKAHEYLEGAKNYLEAELKEPNSDPIPSDDMMSNEDPSGVS
jgi:hypothetical protein